MKTLVASFVGLLLFGTGLAAGRALPRASADADCNKYDPATVTVDDEGFTGWVLHDPKTKQRMALLDNEEDARAALVVARRFSEQCFIGRTNLRQQRKDYIFQYWR